MEFNVFFLKRKLISLFQLSAHTFLLAIYKTREESTTTQKQSRSSATKHVSYEEKQYFRRKRLNLWLEK